MPKLSRRDFLASAGGVTLLALSPVGRGLFAPRDAAAAAAGTPRFTALPYIQPGNGSRLVPGRDTLVVAWQTEAQAADFRVEYGIGTIGYGHRAAVERTLRHSGENSEGRFNYGAVLSGLPLGSRIYYRVRCNGHTLVEGYATTRRARGEKIRFVAFGDNSCGSSADHAIAYQAYRAHPDFVMNVGDNVYDSGLDSEYARYFFPVYNADNADPKGGAPLLRSVPFYTVLGNHDVRFRDAEGRSGGDFNRNAGCLAYYTNMHLPLNGPQQPAPTPLFGDAGKQDVFKKCAGPRYPRMANYSFDYGDAHFLCLDSNIYIDPTDAGMQAWIAADLAGSDALWKFVAFHHPGFDVGGGHYDEQHMRALCPLFEKHGVDIVLSGHEHIYQRARPLRFTPNNLWGARNVHKLNRHVPGEFSIDRVFNGSSHTRPGGVLYMVTGAGGNTLYSPSYTNNPAKWLRADDNNVDYVTTFISDRHSLSVFEIEGKMLTMKQVDGDGNEIDSIKVTKA